MADLQGGRGESLADGTGVRRGRTVRDDLEAALTVVNLHAEWVTPSVRAVGAALGLSADGAHKRLLSAVDAGWLVQTQRGSFRPSRRLRDYLRAEVAP